MGIAYVGSIAAAATSVTMPAGRAVGDFELMWSFRSGSTSAPTVPSGWKLIKSGTATSTFAGLYFRWCTSASDTSGTWTSASGLACAVYRGVLGIGGIVAPTMATTSTVTFPALTLVQSAGNSWIVGCAGHRTATAASMAVAPTGMINRTGATTAFANINDTNGGKTSWSSQTITASASSGNGGETIELLADNSTYDPTNTLGTSGFTLSNSNKTAATAGATGAGKFVAIMLPQMAGKFVGAFTLSVSPSAGNDANVGISGLGGTVSGYPHATDGGMSYFQGQIFVNNASVSTSVDTYGVGDKIYVAVNITSAGAGKCWVLKSGSGNGWDGVGDNPDTNTGGFSFSLTDGFNQVYLCASGNDSFPCTWVWNGADTGSGLASFAPWDSIVLFNNPRILQAVNRASTF